MPKKPPKEELENVKSSNGSNEPGAVGEGAGEQGAGTPSGQSGGESGGEQGTQGGEQGSGGGSNGSGESSGGSERESAKIDLLQRIRAQRSNGLGESSSSTNGASNEHSKTNGGGVPNGNGGTKNDNGSTPRTNRTTGRGNKQTGNGDGGSSQSSPRNDVGDRIGSNQTQSKPQGVDIKGVDKIKALAQKAAAVEPPKLRFQWDEKPLSNKESEEILPKIKALLEFVFRHMDKGISISNRARANAHIWSSIDNEDIEIIATHLVEMGKGSKIVATAVRRMTNSYRLLQIGLITLPKFIQTFQFYQSNGGFAVLGGK